MTQFGVLVIYLAAVVLGAITLSRADGSFRRGLIRAAEQLAIVVPRMLCALLAAVFLVTFIPAEFISRFLGIEAGFNAVIIGTLAGVIVPTGPVISFSIAAVFASAGASVPALVAFITAWSVFAAHRIIIFEIPMLGVSFLRVRLVSVLILPLLAGTLTLAGIRAVSMIGT